MTEREENRIPHEMVNPNYVMQTALDRIGEEATEDITLADAKRIALEFGMLSVTEYVLSGGNTGRLENRTGAFSEAIAWLEAVNKTFENDWTLLVRKLELIGMILEDGWIGGTDKSVRAIHKITGLISDFQNNSK